MRLLIADDNHEAAETLAELLRLLVPPPVEVMVAFDGQQALAAASGSYPSVVIMDIEMPVMDGVSAAVEIRRVLGSRTPILIAATGRSDILNGLCAGGVFDHALLKPLKLDMFLALLLRSHAEAQA